MPSLDCTNGSKVFPNIDARATVIAVTMGIVEPGIFARFASHDPRQQIAAETASPVHPNFICMANS